MRRILSRTVLGVGVLAVVTLILIALVFQVGRGRTPPIDGDRAIASLEQVELGGVPQWILVRGQDARNPVILWLHGGPGMPTMYLAHAFQRQLERDFVVVQWDRSGAGKSYGALGDRPLSVSGRLQDVVELTRLLRERFGGRPIYLVGHSWGSYLGLLAVHEHPEYYRAFIGVGVVAGTHPEVDSVQRTWLRGKARAAGDTATLSRLEAGGAVTESDLFRWGGELTGARSFWPLLRIGLRAPEYTLIDVLNVPRGVQRVHERLSYDLTPAPLEGEYDTLDVPIAFFLGRHDFTTPSSLAAAYLGRLEAPYERVVWFEKSAHFPFLTEPEKFHRAMLDLDAYLEQATVGKGADQASSAPRSASSSRSTDR